MNCIDEMPSDSIDCANIIEIMITMTMTINLNKKDYDNRNNIMKQNDNNITINNYI